MLLESEGIDPVGTWGPGAFENDHAMDLLSVETVRWAAALREQLDARDTSWDDVEGLLVYARLLAWVARDAKPFGLLVDRNAAAPESSRAVAARWRDRFLAIESTSPGVAGRTESESSAFAAARRRVVEGVFDELISAAPDDDAPPPAPQERRPTPRTPG